MKDAERPRGRGTALVRDRSRLALALIVALFLLAAISGITRVPIASGDEMWIAAPAYGLATTGTFGSELFEGYHGAERRTHQFMPMLPLALAGTFRLLGVGLLQMRLVPVAAATLVLVLTHLVGRRAGGPWVGLVAAALLALVPLTSPALPATGIVLVDAARIARYDILVPAFGLAALLVFDAAEARRSLPRYGAAGLLAGGAFLSHVYGGFWLAGMAAVLAFRRGLSGVASAEGASLAAGFLLAAAPWIAYVATDFEAYRGQMRMYAERFDLLDPRFYLRNLVAEPLRYRSFSDGFFRSFRPGGWIALVAIAPSLAIAVRDGLRDRFSPIASVLIALAVLVVSFAVLLSRKTFAYLLSPLPLLAVVVAYGTVSLGQRVRSPALRVAVVGLLLVALASGAWRVVLRQRVAAATTPYDDVAVAMARLVPEGARVLAPARYWLALRGRTVRSWVSPLLRAEVEVGGREEALAAALREAAPEYVVVDGIEFAPYFERIRDPGDPHHWQSAVLESFFAERDLAFAGEIRDPSYGTIAVHRARRP